MDHHTSGQTDCVIQTAKMCKILAQQLTDQVIISRKRRPGETSKALVIKKPKLKKEKLFSNSLWVSLAMSTAFVSPIAHIVSRSL